jgi:hypothetical protein
LFGVDRKWLAEGQNGAFDPTRTSESLVLTGLFVRHPCQYEGLLDGRSLL